MVDRRNRGRIVLAVLALAAGFGIARAMEGTSVDSQPMLGEAAPAFALKGVDGKSLSLGALRGRWLVVHFGASW